MTPDHDELPRAPRPVPPDEDPDYGPESGDYVPDPPGETEGPQPTNGAILWQQTGHEWMIPTRSGRSAVRTDVSLVLSGGMDAIVVGP